MTGVQSAYRRANGPMNLPAYSTGIKFLGDGAWPIAGKAIPRIVFPARRTAQGASGHGHRHFGYPGGGITPSSAGESPVLPELLDQIPEGEEIGTATANGDYDTRRCPNAIIDRKAIAIIPIRKNGRLWKEDCPVAIARNETLRATRHDGRVRRAYAASPGPRSRLTLEAPDQIPRPKPDQGQDALAGSREPVARNLRDLRAFGERIGAQDPDRQTAKILIRFALMNRFWPSAPPGSLAWPDAGGERERRASGLSCATVPCQRLAANIFCQPCKFP